MTAVPHSSGMSRRLVIAYGLPGFVAAIPVIPIAILLPSYYAQDLGVGLTITGIALGLSRLVDFLTDLVIGLAVDRFQWRHGNLQSLRFKPWIVLGAIIAGIGLYALSHPPSQHSNNALGVYLGVWSCVLFLGWTCLMVPYLSWGAILANDIHDRSRLTVARETAGLCGMLVALSAPLLIIDSDLTPLALITWVTIGAGIPLIGLCLTRVPDLGKNDTSDAKTKINIGDIRELLRFKPYRQTLVCWALNSFANGLPAVLFPIVAQQYLMFDQKSVFILLFIYFGAGVIAAPFWLRAAEYLGKVSSWQASIALNVLVFAMVLLINPAAEGFFSPAFFYWICAFSGLSLAADMALPASIQADVMGYDRERHGKQRTSTAFALWSMATKLALAAAVLVGFLTLGGSGEQFNGNDADSRNLLLSLYVIVPVLTKFGVLVLLAHLKKALSFENQQIPA